MLDVVKLSALVVYRDRDRISVSVPTEFEALDCFDRQATLTSEVVERCVASQQGSMPAVDRRSSRGRTESSFRSYRGCFNVRPRIVKQTPGFGLLGECLGEGE